MKKMMLLALVVLSVSGCSSQGWYEGFKSQQRLECEHYTQDYERQRCLERVNGLSYDQYRRETDALKERQ